MGSWVPLFGLGLTRQWGSRRSVEWPRLGASADDLLRPESAAGESRARHPGHCHRRQSTARPPALGPHGLSGPCVEGVLSRLPNRLAHEPIAAGLVSAEAEPTVASALLRRIDWHDRALIGDALFC